MKITITGNLESHTNRFITTKLFTYILTDTFLIVHVKLIISMKLIIYNHYFTMITVVILYWFSTDGLIIFAIFGISPNIVEKNLNVSNG